MHIYRFFSVIVVIITIFTNFFSVINVSAQVPLAFGEIKAEGDVLIESSTGRWVKLPGIYPLLANTKLRTNVGIVSITTNDGSRIDISKNTEAVINVTDSTYTVDLLSCIGILFFNMSPSALLTVNTSQATVSTIEGTTTNMQGMVIGSNNGTEVRSISGAINAGYRDKEQRVLNAGERLFAGGECTPVVLAGTTAGNTARLSQALIIGTFFTGVIVIANDAFRGKGGPASPSSP